MDREALTVGFFRPEDAEGVAKLFTEVYGDGYPAKIVYHRDELIKAFENHDQIPIVVRTPGDRVVGYSSLFRAALDKRVYEKGNGAVAMDFRNAGKTKGTVVKKQIDIEIRRVPKGSNRYYRLYEVLM